MNNIVNEKLLKAGLMKKMELVVKADKELTPVVKEYTLKMLANSVITPKAAFKKGQYVELNTEDRRIGKIRQTAMNWNRKFKRYEWRYRVVFYQGMCEPLREEWIWEHQIEGLV